MMLAVFLLASATSLAQLKVTAVEELPLGRDQDWSEPRFSPDGSRIFLTTSGYDGIWEYRLADRKLRIVTADPKSGYGFAISADGNRIAYRRTSYGAQLRDRLQEIIVKDMTAGTATLLASGRELSLPAFASSAVLYATPKRIAGTPRTSVAGSVTLIGIDNGTVVLEREGRRVTLDPLHTGRLLWPALSPDRTELVAYDMEQGAFVCTVDGTLLARLGKRDAPCWTRDGRWIVYMMDKDDGHRIQSSDLYAVSSDGTRTVQLTSTDDVIELYPQCSPVDNRISYSTLDGRVRVLTYAEEGK
jgi:Tol biopolymer transport system component